MSRGSPFIGPTTTQSGFSTTGTRERFDDSGGFITDTQDIDTGHATTSAGGIAFPDTHSAST